MVQNILRSLLKNFVSFILMWGLIGLIWVLFPFWYIYDRIYGKNFTTEELSSLNKITEEIGKIMEEIDKKMPKE